MVDPKAIEAWFKLMARASRGSPRAREAMASVGSPSSTPEELARWWEQFVPSAGRSTPEAFQDWLEDWWRMMGVVPRARYLEVLERCEVLRGRMEEAEERIRHLRSMLGKREHQAEAERVPDAWEKTLEGTLAAQSEWMLAWTTRYGEAEKASGKEENG